MTTKMNLNGATRKALVAAIAEITGEKVIYRAIPTCNYDIGDITVTKDGCIICQDNSDILTALEEAGFTTESEAAESDGQPLRGYQGRAGRPCGGNQAARHPQARIRAVHYDAGKPAQRGDGIQRGPLGKPGRILNGVHQR